MDVSVIIVNYNTMQMTRECIDSVFKCTRLCTFEVILVDNASVDGSKACFEADSRIKYIYSDVNVGFGNANNLALATSAGRNVLFLNSDTILINDAISLMSIFLDKNACVGCCGGNLYSASKEPAHSFQRFSPLWKEIDGLLGGD